MKVTKKCKRRAMQLLRLCLRDGTVQEDRARYTVEQLVAIKPRGYLGTLWQFRRLVGTASSERDARIESTVALPADLQETVKLNLRQIYGPGLSTSFVQNPALLGGMRIQVGSDVYDGSVRARLAALHEHF